MRLTYRKVTIIKFNKEPIVSSLDQELQALGTSLGLFTLRDKDKSCYRIFITLIKKAKKNESITSDELAFALNLTRGTVIHHINHLLSAGIVVEKNNGYALRAENIQKLISEMKKDVDKMYDDLYLKAEKLDRELGF